MESDRIPVHQSYWRRHRGELIVAVLSGVASLSTILILSWMMWDNPRVTGYIMGPSLPLFFGIAAVILVGSIVLPIHWYLTDKRIEAILNEDDEDDADGAAVVLGTGVDAEEVSEHEQVEEVQRQW